MNKIQPTQTTPPLPKGNGKPDPYGTQTLSPDGKSFTDISCNAAKPDHPLHPRALLHFTRSTT